MTEPGAVAAPSPGWWVRTNRVGVSDATFGFWAVALGATNPIGDASSGYGWATTAVGYMTGGVDQGSMAYVATEETTSAGSYTDLTTTTDTVTVTVPATGMVLVSIYSCMSWAAPGFVSYALSGANTRSASNDRAIYNYAAGAQHCSATFLETGLSTGSTTFKMKYYSSSGTAYKYRRISVNPVRA